MRLSSWHPLLITSVACVASFQLYRATLPAQAEPVPPQTPHLMARSEKAPDRFEGARIQVAILLDTSNSMDGLIHQAKRQLWNIVKELGEAEVDGKTPRFEVALYEYGNDGLSVTKNYVRQVLPFSTDLDKVSEELNRLKTNGGEEYCGAVIQDSLKNLEWSQREGDLTAIFIAGNEPFDQGSVSFKEACAAARQKGVVVNTIFCGNKLEGERTKWSEGANLAAGRFFCIDADRSVAEAPTPYDAKLAQLNSQLNTTYIGYGVNAPAAQARQMAADAAAGSAPEASGYVASRAQAKAGANYSNEEWDLVDAKKKGRVDLGALSKDELPAELREKTVAERKQYVEQKSAERERIQNEIREEGKKRDAYLAEQKAKNGPDTSLEGAILGAIREQAKQRGFKFKS
ncbi:MAG: VWA domain-containing protein [Candidatus Eremiobacteraeota bacterium]|nr:VWA domain-containing protein [Candidatus Eremiobacteraeota bacterium]MCW5866993.1 VWA domain-containing protein [Candidatus Eremiobacteraeota bacterium]